MVSRGTRELLLGALVIALLAVVFLWRPIAAFDAGFFSPADLSQAHALTRVEPNVRAGNVVVSDTWTQFQPWAMFDAAEVARGRLPLWNRLNGGGVPHLANFQSAVFSPFTVPYYVFGLRAALIVSAFLKLWALGFCTFLFLRELRLSFWAATFGAVVYMFAGHQVLTLGYPHSGVAAALPAALFALERLARRFESHSSSAAIPVSAHSPHAATADGSAGPANARGVLAPGTSSTRAWTVFTPFAGPLALLVLALGLGILAGHPETIYYVALFTGLYAVARGAGLWRRHRGVPGATARLAALTMHVGVAVALAVGLCAIQLLPFFEYLRNSAALVGRTSGHQTPLPAVAWPLQMFPNLLGNPANPYFVDDTLPRPGFELVNLAYLGGFALILAVFAPFLTRRRKAATAFLVAALVWVAYAYDVLGFARLLAHVPTLDVAPMNRSQILFHLCIAAAASFAVDALIEPTRRRRVSAAFVTFAAGVALVWLFRAQAFVLANRVKTMFPSGDVRDLITSGSLAHVEAITLSCLVGLGAVAVLLAVRRVRVWLGLVLVAVAYAQSGGLFAGYHPVTPDKFFYPRTAALERIVDRVGSRDFVVMGKDGLPPATNMVYGLRQIANYDALSILRYDQLYRRVFNDGGNWREVERGSSLALQLFGIDYVLSPKAWVDIDTAFPSLKPVKDAEFASAGITPDSAFTQDFVGVRDGLDGVSFTWVTSGGTNASAIEVRLVDVETGGELCVRRFETGVIGDRGHDVEGSAIRANDGTVEALSTAATTGDLSQAPGLVRFPSIRNSKGRAFRLVISTPDTRASDAPALVCRRDMAYWIDVAHRAAEGQGPVAGRPHPSTAGWRARQGGADVNGHLVLELHHALESFVAEERVAGLTLFRFESSCSRYHTVTHAVVARDDQESWNIVLSDGFDPRRTVVLEAADPALATAADPAIEVDEPVEILNEDHGRVTLRTHRARPGWLVTSQSWYPGWTARVCGAAVKPECANYAFLAVPIPAGDCVVELEYAPRSVARGAWISLASLVCAIAWLVSSWWFAARPRA